MQDLFTKVSTNDILQFLQECDFFDKFKDFFSNFFVRLMGL